MAAIGVGIIGANPDRGWGSAVHIPAILSQPAFTLMAVCTTGMESASRSAERFGAPLAFDDPADLVAHPEVDLVVVAVKAPDHHCLAMMALAAGKHVYCEWPLAVTVAQAEEMARLAASRGVYAMVGLQARGAPVLRYLRDLIADGYVGRVVSVRMNCALPGGGGRRSREGLYVIHKVNGAGTLAIQGGHSIDALQYCAGRMTRLTAVVANQFDTVEVIETGEIVPKDAPDQILICGYMENGAVASIAINGGVVAGHGISIDVFGDRGSLSLRGAQALGFQMAELELFGARSPDRKLVALDLPEGYDPRIIPEGLITQQPYPGVDVPRATLVNVANLYRDLGRAIGGGHDLSPSFEDGLRLHRLLDRIETSAMAGAAA